MTWVEGFCHKWSVQPVFGTFHRRTVIHLCLGRDIGWGECIGSQYSVTVRAVELLKGLRHPHSLHLSPPPACTTFAHEALPSSISCDLQWYRSDFQIGPNQPWWARLRISISELPSIWAHSSSFSHLLFEQNLQLLLLHPVACNKAFECTGFREGAHCPTTPYHPFSHTWPTSKITPNIACPSKRGTAIVCCPW